MYLTPEEEGMLNGDEGLGVQYAMQALAKFGDAVQAEKMVPIRQAHASYSAWFIAREPGLEWLRNLVDLGAKARVPLTSQCAQFDLEDYDLLQADPDIVENQKALSNAHLQLGSVGIWSCSPYVIGNQPMFGSHMASVESSAVPIYNGIFGARTIRNVGQGAILAAICGRTPYFDMHVTENRRANVLVNVEAELDPTSEVDYTLLGYWTGEQIGNRNPCFNTLRFMFNSLYRTLRAAMATAGAPSIFHIPGLTPEAKTIADAFQNDKPEFTITFTEDDKKATQEKLNTATETDGKIDFVDLGCPHYDYSDLMRLAAMVDGKKMHKDVFFSVWTSRATRQICESTGCLNVLKRAGINVLCDACPVQDHGPRFYGKTGITNSGKQAGYAWDISHAKVFVSNMKDCVKAGIQGHMEV